MRSPHSQCPWRANHELLESEQVTRTTPVRRHHWPYGAARGLGDLPEQSGRLAAICRRQSLPERRSQLFDHLLCNHCHCGCDRPGSGYRLHYRSRPGIGRPYSAERASVADQLLTVHWWPCSDFFNRHSAQPDHATGTQRTLQNAICAGGRNFNQSARQRRTIA